MLLVRTARNMSTVSKSFATGFTASGVRAGIKKRKAHHTADPLDVALICSEQPCVAAGVFTKNLFCAAPVQVCKEILAANGNQIRGVAINSGCANACTGDQGLLDAREMSAFTSKLINGTGQSLDTLVMSTGVIGPLLPMDKIKAGLTDAASRLSVEEGWTRASEAVMTTDTVPKLVGESFELRPGSVVTLTGIAKGAGMIHPNMATMLSVICTDAAIEQKPLQEALSYVVDRSFNCVTVDGDTSTNDSLVVLANGMAKDVQPITSSTSPEFFAFRTQLLKTALHLAKWLVRDGEGATKFASVLVQGARSFEQAKQIASSIACSSLVKTALYGQDANWGRIVCAAGYAGVPLVPEEVSLYISNPDGKELHLFKDGRPFDTNEQVASNILRQTDINIRLVVGNGEHEATYYTSDFSEDYVKVNASYRS